MHDSLFLSWYTNMFWGNLLQSERLLRRQCSHDHLEIASVHSSPIHRILPLHRSVPKYHNEDRVSSFTTNNENDAFKGDVYGYFHTSDDRSTQLEWSDDAVEAAPLMLKMPAKCARSQSGNSKNGDSLYARSFGVRSNENLLLGDESRLKDTTSLL